MTFGAYKVAQIVTSENDSQSVSYTEKKRTMNDVRRRDTWRPCHVNFHNLSQGISILLLASKKPLTSKLEIHNLLFLIRK